MNHLVYKEGIAAIKAGWVSMETSITNLSFIYVINFTTMINNLGNSVNF